MCLSRKGEPLYRYRPFLPTSRLLDRMLTRCVERAWRTTAYVKTCTIRSTTFNVFAMSVGRGTTYNVVSHLKGRFGGGRIWRTRSTACRLCVERWVLGTRNGGYPEADGIWSWWALGLRTRVFQTIGRSSSAAILWRSWSTHSSPTTAAPPVARVPFDKYSLFFIYLCSLYVPEFTMRDDDFERPKRKLREHARLWEVPRDYGIKHYLLLTRLFWKCGRSRETLRGHARLWEITRDYGIKHYYITYAVILKVREITRDFERSRETPRDLERSCMAIGDVLAS